jgi:phosphopantothenate---cysteine ligase (ATP)
MHRRPYHFAALNYQYRSPRPSHTVSFMMSTQSSSVDNNNADLALALNAFVLQHAGLHHRPIAVVSSGGTAVDLEVHAVRCLENFSTGTRGAMAVEGFLQRGYAVIHLWRTGSAAPYARFLATELLGLQQPNHGLSVDCLARLFANAHEDDINDDDENEQVQQALDPWLTSADSAVPSAAATRNATTMSGSRSNAQTVALHRSLVHSTRLHKVLRERSTVLTENRLITVPFRTVEDYLTKLQTVSTAVNSCHALALFFLAAAVSDFYIPANERVQHKIQSSDYKNNTHGSSSDNKNGDDGDDGEGLVLHLKPVPKTMGKLRTEWAPNAFCVSFKLETDMALLRKKAERAVQKYGCHMVIGNILETRHSTVWILAPPTQREKNPHYPTNSNNDTNDSSNATSPSVQDWAMREISRPNINHNDTGRIMDITNALEDALLDAVVQGHFEFLSWHFHQPHEGSGVHAVRKRMQEMEQKKQEAKQQLFWKRVQKTGLELVGVALSILFSYAISSALQRRQQRLG